MMMRLMFIVICDVVSSVLVLTGRRPRLRDWARLLLSSDCSPGILRFPVWREKLVCIAIFLSKPETAVLRLTRRKETPAQEPQGVPRRVEDLIGGDPSGVCRTGRRPLKPQTVLLRWRRAVGLRRTTAASRAERKRASRSRVLIRVQKRASLAFGLPPIGGRGRRIRSGLRRTLGSPRRKRKARLSGSPGRKSFLPNHLLRSVGC